ncbi:ABC transporter substrate-binding protein [Metarhizobium album]|uniref:ABC transporter substrate-binding protein n=1 Tax=Metarhizobium album TaxID=2182425 RepID=A0A2U2DJH4_9HYPH|nr:MULTISPECIES: ABC transporter substrate-binding protein [Rhizobium/Agrobacterium group]NTA40252.1 ABC transporter substrate-binding protein [Agrobacterium salinitolerans]PWE53428.1 ABC transporter substrate-binding protein [Rhizobium album]
MGIGTKSAFSKSLSRRKVLTQAAGVGAGLLMAPSLIRSASAAGDPIRIGFVTPQTGAMATFSTGLDFVLESFRQAIGEGIKVGDAVRPVEILVRDSQSSSSRSAEVAAELITNDNVVLMLASSSSDTVGPVADQCELNGVPCISTDVPWEPYFFGRGGNPETGFDYTYHFFWGVDQIIQTFTSLWSKIETNKVVGALWSNDTDGVAISNPEHGFPPRFKAAGYELFDAGLFTPGAADYTAQIAKLKEAKCEILTGVFNPGDFATFWSQAGQQGYHPKIATIAKALLFPASIEAVGERGYGLSTEVWWSPNHPFKSGLSGQSARDFCAAYTDKTKRQWVQPLGFKYALLEVAVDVLKRTKDINDPKSIVEAITATDYQSIVGSVRWQGGPVKNVSLTPLVGGQWSKGNGFPYDLDIVDNAAYPGIATKRPFAPIAW